MEAANQVPPIPCGIIREDTLDLDDDGSDFSDSEWCNDGTEKAFDESATPSTSQWIPTTCKTSTGRKNEKKRKRNPRKSSGSPAKVPRCVAGTSKVSTTGSKSSHRSTAHPKPSRGWNANPSSAPPEMTFLGSPKVNIFTGDNPSIMDVFQAFFSHEFFYMALLATNTNAQRMLHDLTYEDYHCGVLKDWKPTTIPELKNFFAIVFHMGLTRKPYMSNYWSTDVIFAESFTSRVMSHARFCAILTALYFSTEPKEEGQRRSKNKPLRKLMPVLHYFEKKFSEIVSPAQNLSLDGAISPLKPPVKLLYSLSDSTTSKKWCVRLCQLCESSSGYCWRFGVFFDYTSPERGYEMVMKMLRGLPGKGHHIYMNESFTSPKLFYDLSQKSVFATGTCTKYHNDLPVEYLGKKLANGKSVACRKGKILALKWHEYDRDILLLSTASNSEMGDFAIRGGTAMKKRPVVLQNYKSNMRVHDEGHAALSYFSLARKGIQSWKKLFFSLVHIGLFNAHKVYNMIQLRNHQATVPLLGFIVEVTRGLAQDALSSPSSSQPLRVSRLVGRHFPELIPASEKEQQPQRPCKVCFDTETYMIQMDNRRKRQVHQRSGYWCPECKVTLCIGSCFRKYHSENNYHIPAFGVV